MKGDLFRGVVQWEFNLPDPKLKQKRFRLPVFYYDNSSMNAIYTASTKLVRQYLPDPRMHPIELTPGRCLVSISAFEYHKTDIDPYNEFSIAFMISFRKKALPFFSLLSQKRRNCFEMFIRHLPVSTEIARYGGVELYGFPKILAKIDITRENGISQCVLSEKKTHILTLKGPMLHAKQGKTVCYKTYPLRQGVTLLGNVYMMFHQYAETRDTKDVVLSLGGDHVICRELKSIDLSEKAVMYQYAPSAESILFGPRNLIDN